MVGGFRGIGLDVHFILMVGGGDPMNPDDEKHRCRDTGRRTQGSTNSSNRTCEFDVPSRRGCSPAANDETVVNFDQAVIQNVHVHSRAYDEAGLDDSVIKAWHIEFLRQGEFQTFTDIGRIANFVMATNEAVGTSFFKVLVDAAHCGDSGLSVKENENYIAEIAKNDALGIFHASAKTTAWVSIHRHGWGWVPCWLPVRERANWNSLVEVFHHEDPALEGLRELDAGHGIDTPMDVPTTKWVTDGLVDVARRLNNLKARRMLA